MKLELSHQNQQGASGPVPQALPDLWTQSLRARQQERTRQLQHRLHTQAHARAHVLTHTQALVQTHMHTHMRAHTNVPVRLHAHSHTHKHTCALTHKRQKRASSSGLSLSRSSKITSNIFPNLLLLPWRGSRGRLHTQNSLLLQQSETQQRQRE